MDYIGIDVHASESQICTLTGRGSSAWGVIR